MVRKATTLQRRLVKIIVLITGAALLVACSAILMYEFRTFRQTALEQVSTLGHVIAANSTAALAFDTPEDANEILLALQAERPVTAAALYDKAGRLFAYYPATVAKADLPETPGDDGYHFVGSNLVGFQSVVQGDNKRQGALYLKWDMTAMNERFAFYGGTVVLIMTGCFLVAAYVLSRMLQRQISQPILALAETAKAVSNRRDYTVRAIKSSDDEIGLLTDAFNHMLTQIQEQNGALKGSEQRLRAVLDSALSAVVMMDAEGTIVDWNPRAESMFGWTGAEARGRELASTIIPSAFRDLHRNGLAHLRVSGDGPVLNRVLELTALRRDGSEFPIELSICPIRTDGVVTFCGFATDITERKHAESRLQAQLSRLELLHRITRSIAERQDLPSIFQVMLRSLEDNLPIDFGCVCLYDAANQSLSVTKVGVHSESLAMELAMTDKARIPIDQNGLSICVRGKLVYEPEAKEVPYPFSQRLAKLGLHSFVAAPLLVEGNVFGVLIAARYAANGFVSADCEFLQHLCEHVALASHQVNLYGALQQAYDDLRQTQQTVLQQERLRALGQMASGIAHDINNAISPVSLYTESLLEREPGLSERARDYLTTIQRAIQDVAVTVSRMREFYRHREAQLELMPINLGRIIQQVIDLTRPRWRDVPQQHGVMIDLRTKLAEGLPNVPGAEAEIRDALTNLIFNAVDAMPSGGIVTIRTCDARRQGPGNPGDRREFVYVEVSDTGTGMDEDTRRRCLEPFFTTKGERGTGLGLAMVYGMAKRHSAEIEIESKPGEGTTVRLMFPISDAVVSTAGPSASSAALRGLRILVVDDDPLLMKALRDTLESDGHHITTASGGLAGIEAFTTACASTQPYSLVITDLGMPHVDGRKVASAVKAISPSTPVILLTGWGQRLVADGDIPADVDRVLGKPPRLLDLREAFVDCMAIRGTNATA